MTTRHPRPTTTITVTGPRSVPSRAVHASSSPSQSYQRPQLTRLGTLAELTHGGSVSAQSDGFGFAGGSGTAGP